jgi:ribonuclease HI
MEVLYIMKYYILDLCSKNVLENYLEDNFSISYKTKISNRNKKEFKYFNCLVDNNNYNLLINDKNISIINNIKEIPVLRNHFKIFSDGGSFNNGYKKKDLPMFGSYGYVLTMDGEKFDIGNNAKKDWTNNIGELSGAIEGLKTLFREYELTPFDKPIMITIVSDSQYVVKGCTEYIWGWIDRGWRNNENKPTPNKELWQEMLKFIKVEGIELRFMWVRGHTLKEDFDSQMNELCDKLATESLHSLVPRELLK